MNLIWLLIIVLIVLALAGAPSFNIIPHSYGWAPSGVVMLIVIVLLILLLTGRL